MTEKAADAETSGVHCPRVFLPVSENLLKQPCRFASSQVRGSSDAPDAAKVRRPNSRSASYGIQAFTQREMR
jgi:hypothetical protein